MTDLRLCVIPKTYWRLQRDMRGHYSHPRGFVGRSICYAVLCDRVYYGSIVAGSCTLHLPGRNEFFAAHVSDWSLDNVVNNVFFHVTPHLGKYPCRNFTQRVIRTFRERVRNDWPKKYGHEVIGFESLVEPPRTGELYRRDGWTEVGTTKGFTCKRVAGESSDDWSGKRVWDMKNLRPKIVLCRLAI